MKPIWSTVPALFAKLSSCIDPFLYAMNNFEIRREILSRLCFCCSCRQPDDVNVDTFDESAIFQTNFNHLSLSSNEPVTVTIPLTIINEMDPVSIERTELTRIDSLKIRRQQYSFFNKPDIIGRNCSSLCNFYEQTTSV